ncbi:hypothetical protein OPW19_20810 [Vibrio europaeus]|uniref:hypothetical protein n=1 Tax=Vibrio europaeus TaxID=300876 RepID=UPI00233F1866|nr:hypothetical protein [Vibrio europaeus]MDC5822260.1 hypothetical protein [Vibrio europaeus]
MKAPWSPDDATICYEANGCAADRKLGIAVRGIIDLASPNSLLKGPYDVSVKDVCLSGTLEAIVVGLDKMETRNPRYFYVTNRYESIKIWINKPSDTLNAAVENPFADAVIHNLSGIAMAWAGPKFGETVSPVLKGLIPSQAGEGIKTATGMLAEQILAQGGNVVSPKSKATSPNSSIGNSAVNLSNIKDVVLDGYTIGKQIANAVSSTNSYDITFKGTPPQTPVFRDKSKRKNKVRSMLIKAKNIFAPDKVLIRVGSEFNKHHAGTVIDLGVRSISCHDLIDFLTYYSEKGKLMNCFHDRSNDNALVAKINVI